MEKCANCGRQIGNLEMPYVFSGRVVCQGCDALLRRQVDTKQVNATLTRKWYRSVVVGAAAILVITLALIWLFSPRYGTVRGRIWLDNEPVRGISVFLLSHQALVEMEQYYHDNTLKKLIATTKSDIGRNNTALLLTKAQVKKEINPRMLFEIGNRYYEKATLSDSTFKTGYCHMAADWWRKAAAKGNVNAMVGLGILYYCGNIGTDWAVHGQNWLQKAVAKQEMWWRKAAAKGDAEAKKNLFIYAHSRRWTDAIAKAWWREDGAVAHGKISSVAVSSCLKEVRSLAAIRDKLKRDTKRLQSLLLQARVAEESVHFATMAITDTATRSLFLEGLARKFTKAKRYLSGFNGHYEFTRLSSAHYFVICLYSKQEGPFVNRYAWIVPVDAHDGRTSTVNLTETDETVNWLK